MRNLHKVAIIIIAVIMLAGTSTVSAHFSKTQADKPTVKESQAQDSAGDCETCDGKETTTTMPPGFTVPDSSLEKAQAEVKFKLRTPSYMMSGAKQAVGVIKQHDDSGKVIGTGVVLRYDISGTSTDKLHRGGLVVLQIPGEGPKETFFPTSDIEIDGVMGKVQAPKGVGKAPIQIFWTKDGIYYNVFGEGLSEEELIKIARSLR